MQLSQEIFNILKGANIKLKLFDPMGNKTLDPELSARFYAYDNDFLVTIREDEDDAVELVVQAGASFNFDKHKDVLDSIKKAGHNAMAEYNIRKFDKNIEPKDFAHDVVKEDEEIRRLKELSGIRKEPIEEHRSEDWHCKDCGDEMHKPTTDCGHDSHDEDGDWWVDENGNGIHDKLEEDPEDRKMQVTKIDKELNTEAWKRFKDGDPRYEWKDLDAKESVEEADDEDEEQKTVAVNGPVALSGDSIWFRDSKSPTSVNVGEVTAVITDGWAEVYVNHDGPWEIYTDTGFEKAISEIIGFEAGWSEQGLQQEGKAHLEGQVEMQENASVMEGYSPATGSMKTSYIQLPENTKLIIKHTKGVNEEVRGSRSRNIRALFIENSAGERFRFPHKYLQGAKAMANHVSKGGTPYDAIGESITKLCTEVAQCSQFLRHVRTNKLTNEGNANIVETVKEKLKEFKSTVKSLQTSRGYNNYQVPTTAIVEENDKESVDLTDKFMYNTFETANMDAVLETVARIVKEKDGMTDLTKTNINRLYDMIKNKEDFKLNIDPNDPEHPDNEDPIKYSGGNGAMAKLVSHLSYLAMNSKNDEVFNLLSQISGEMYSLPKEHVILLAKIAAYLDKNNKAPAKEPAMEDIAEATLNNLRRKIA